ncbi:MAG: aromatic acid exporter family protein [Clostridiaceae bacterium]|nr:aromatic acid exporter family protein [Clostridiaceae bacterium]
MGMRNIKTALAVIICVLISRILKLEYSFYAAIAAIISMENTVINSFRAGKNRMLGTLIGAGIGFLCASIVPGNAILCGIGVVIVIYICNLLKWEKSISIACIVFMAIMVNLNGKNPFVYSMNRILDTFIGITVAVLVNYFIFPPNYANDIKRNCLYIVDRIDKLVQGGVLTLENLELDAIMVDINDLQKQISMHEGEFRLSKKSFGKIDNIKSSIKLDNNIINHLKVIDNLRNKSTSNKEIVIDYIMCEINDDLKKLKELMVLY